MNRIVNRIDINYGGRHYTVGNRSVEDVQDEVQRILATGTPGWLTVNYGAGSLREARLLITIGVPLSLAPTELPDAEIFVQAQAEQAEDILAIDPII